MLSYYVIYCEKFTKVLQWIEKVALSKAIYVTYFYMSLLTAYDLKNKKLYYDTLITLINS